MTKVYMRYFVVDEARDEVLEGGKEFKNLCDNVVYKALKEVSHMKPDDETSMKEFENLDSAVDDDCPSDMLTFNVKLGAFCVWKDKFTLEETFDSVKAMFESMKPYCLEELDDMIYAPYIEIERRERERQTSHYDTLTERWLAEMD